MARAASPSTWALLAILIHLQSTNAITLGDLGLLPSLPLLTPVACVTAASATIPNCVSSDFGANGCSQACAASVANLRANLQSECGGGIIGAITGTISNLLTGGVQNLCKTIATTEQSSIQVAPAVAATAKAQASAQASAQAQAQAQAPAVQAAKSSLTSAKGSDSTPASSPVPTPDAKATQSQAVQSSTELSAASQPQSPSQPTTTAEPSPASTQANLQKQQAHDTPSQSQSVSPASVQPAPASSLSAKDSPLTTSTSAPLVSQIASTSQPASASGPSSTISGLSLAPAAVIPSTSVLISAGSTPVPEPSVPSSQTLSAPSSPPISATLPPVVPTQGTVLSSASEGGAVPVPTQPIFLSNGTVTSQLRFTIPSLVSESSTVVQSVEVLTIPTTDAQGSTLTLFTSTTVAQTIIATPPIVLAQSTVTEASVPGPSGSGIPIPITTSKTSQAVENEAPVSQPPPLALPPASSTLTITTSFDPSATGLALGVIQANFAPDSPEAVEMKHNQDVVGAVIGTFIAVVVLIIGSILLFLRRRRRIQRLRDENYVVFTESDRPAPLDAPYRYVENKAFAAQHAAMLSPSRPMRSLSPVGDMIIPPRFPASRHHSLVSRLEDGTYLRSSSPTSQYEISPISRDSGASDYSTWYSANGFDMYLPRRPTTEEQQLIDMDDEEQCSTYASGGTGEMMPYIAPLQPAFRRSMSTIAETVELDGEGTCIHELPGTQQWPMAGAEGYKKSWPSSSNEKSHYTGY